MTTPRILDPFFRGDRFAYSFELGNGWEGDDFAEVQFTLRDKPASATDTDASALAYVTKTGGGITFVGAVGTVVIEASRTKRLPTGQLYWDLQCKITASPEDRIETPESGTVVCRPDVTRST